MLIQTFIGCKIQKLRSQTQYYRSVVVKRKTSKPLLYIYSTLFCRKYTQKSWIHRYFSPEKDFNFIELRK